ncbi:MAG TPA: hypothetical protein VFP84_16935 [Kofleriaceae bacterium]|nr:hypothetical protein [Kofleriaceae bacterium]
MRRLVIAAAVAGCAPRAPAVQTPAAPAAPAVPVTPSVAAPVSPWAAVPVRVMTWTAHGTEPIATLPGPLPAVMPAHWFVEPIGALDAAGLARLVGLVRSERVPGLALRGRAVAAGLDQLRDLPDLRALLLDGSDVDGAALARVQLPALTRLYLAHTVIDDAAAEHLVAQFPALDTLDLEATAVGDAGARAIARLTGLHALDLAETRVGDDGGAALASLTALEVADLGRTRVGDKTVAALAHLPLHELFLDRTRVRGQLARLARLAPTLVRFDVSATAHHPGDGELAWLAGASQLVELGVSGAKLHDPLAQKLVRLPALRELRMADAAITVATVRAIAARADLEEIDLADDPVDDASAAAMLAAPNLRTLRLDGTKVGDAALADVTPGAALRELYLSSTAITDRGLAILDRLPGLVALGAGHTAIGDAAIARVARLSELRTLVLSKIGAGADALAQLGRLAQLERLYLDQTRAGDGVLAALAPAREHLRVLHLASSDVSDAGLAALRALPALEELTLGDTRITAGIADLSAWPRLHTLSLTGLLLGDAALPALAARASLVVLDLSATDVRDPSPLAALPHLRTLGIAQVKLSAAGVVALKQLAARGVEIAR